MDTEPFVELLRILEEGRPCALATVVETTGSTPRKAGSKMLIRDDGSTSGTLGGGVIEQEVIREAKQALRKGRPRLITVDVKAAPETGTGGGTAQVFIDPLKPAPKLFIIGAGHVGAAVCRLAGQVGFYVTVADDRAEFLSRERLPDADELVLKDPSEAIDALRPDERTAIIICTRSHELDYAAVQAGLCSQAGFIGLLGSIRKKAAFMKRLREEGHSEEDLARITTPVGLPIGAETPEEIAVSILAQLVEIRRERWEKEGTTG